MPLAPSTSLQHNGKLKRLLDGTTGRVESLVLIIPGLRSSPQLDRRNTTASDSWPWLSRLPFADKAAFFLFEHALIRDEPPSDERIEEEGKQLRQVFKQLIGDDSFANLPIFFVAYSVGGILLKRAICLAFGQHDFPEQLVAGAILISTPHSRENTPEAWGSLTVIYQLFHKIARRFPVSPQMADSLARDCKDFERAFDNLPLLSLFEDKESRLGLARWNSRVLIGKTLACTDLRCEEEFRVKLSHKELPYCLPEDIEAFGCFKKFLASKLSAKRDELKQGQGQCIRTVSSAASDIGTGVRTHGAGATVTFSDVTGALSRLNLPCFVMPYNQNPGFHARESTMTRIRDVLCAPPGRESGSSPPPRILSVALSGMGGVGKTQVAMDFVHRHKDDFDAIFWVNADELEKLNQAYHNIAISLGLVSEDSVDAKDKRMTRELVLNWLEYPYKSHERRKQQQVDKASWLVVFDNVIDPDILDDFWPPDHASGSVLITSRDPLNDSEYRSLTLKESLQPFQEDEAAEVLIRITKRKNVTDDVNNAGKVAEMVGGLPLAIVQMAGVILRKDISFAEFLLRYRRELSRNELLETRVGGRRSVHFGEYHHTVASVWCFEDLKFSAYLLDVLSFLDPDGIPEYIVQGNKAGIDMEGFPQSEEQYEKARDELLQSALITRDRENQKLVIHRLVQDTARSKMKDKRYSDVFTSALQLLSSVWPYEDALGFSNETYRWSRCMEIYPHVLCLRKFADYVNPPPSFSQEHIKPPKLLLESAWFSIMRADYADTQPFLDMAAKMIVPLKQDVDGMADQEQAVLDEYEEQTRLFNLHSGVLGLHVNEPAKSLSNLHEFKSLLRQKIGARPRGNDQRMGVAWNELGNAYLQYGNSKDADTCFRMSIKAFQALDKVSSNTFSMPLISLGYALLHQRRLEEAEGHFEWALEEREAEYGPDDTVSFATGKLLLGYGDVKAEQGDFDESFALHKRCLAQYRATLGRYHHRVADGSIRVSDHLFRLDEYGEANDLLDQAISIYGTREHFTPERARAHYKRWRVRSKLNLSREAEEDATQALELYRRLEAGDQRGIDDLAGSDFDKNVMFWSK